MAKKSTRNADFTVPGSHHRAGPRRREILQTAPARPPNDLQLTLKHAHWNVAGPQLHRGDETLDRRSTIGPWPRGRPRGAHGHHGRVPRRCRRRHRGQRTWRHHDINRRAGRAGTSPRWTSCTTASSRTTARRWPRERRGPHHRGHADRPGPLELFQWFMCLHISPARGVCWTTRGPARRRPWRSRHRGQGRGQLPHLGEGLQEVGHPSRNRNRPDRPRDPRPSARARLR
ncbi:hypothetical protein QJS66_11600 [Kocuria rhizophila]|nr:hypothetical protein QJS66_11600 [Kocuria rhizophila]